MGEDFEIFDEIDALDNPDESADNELNNKKKNAEARRLKINDRLVLVFLIIFTVSSLVTMGLSIKMYMIETSKMNNQNISSMVNANNLGIKSDDDIYVATQPSVEYETQPQKTNTAIYDSKQGGQLGGSVSGNDSSVQTTSSSGTAQSPATTKLSEATTSAASSGLININTATAEELAALNGIGEKKAQAIIDYRTEHGAFKSVEDLTNVSGIGEKTLEKNIDKITVD